MILKKTNALFIFVILIALALRLVIVENIFLSSDDADIPNNIIKNYSLDKIDNLFIQGHGITAYIMPLITYSIINKLLNIDINEFIWHLHSLIFGIIGLIYLYLYTKLISKPKTAILTLLLFSVFPAHVYFSSKIYLFFLILDFTFLYMSLYYVTLFSEQQNKKNALFAGLSIALYILTSIVFPLIFLILLIIFLKKRKKIKLTNISELFFIPIILSLAFLITTNIISYTKYGKLTGVVGHVFNSSSGGIGLFLISYIKSLFILAHPINIIILFLLSLILIKLFGKSNNNVLIYFGLIYSIPYLFFFTRFIEGVAPYLLNAFSFFLIWFVVNLFNSKFKQRIRILIYLTVLIVFLLGLLNLIFPNIDSGWFNTGIYGLYNVHKLDDSGVKGIKEVAEWIKNNTNNNATIFSDAIGGAGIEPPVAEYYFQRKNYALFDGQEDEVKQLFEEVKDKVDILVLKHNFIKPDKEFIKVFKLTKNNETIIKVYKRL